MPYQNNADLPEAVRNALPAAAQDIWREAFNSAEKKYPGDEERASRIAWGAVKNAGWEKGDDGWVKKSGNAKTHEFEAEIFSAGTWNGDKYSEADLDDIVANFAVLKDEIKPPVKPGHSGGFGKPGDLAFGWVTGLKRSGSKLIATFSQVPDIVYNAIRAGRFKRVSAEIYWNFKNNAGRTFKRVLAAVSVLGADIPAVTNLEDLEAYLTQSTPPNGGSFEKVAAYGFDLDGAGNLITDKGDDDMEKKELEAKLDAEKKKREKAEADAKQYREKAEAQRKKQADEQKKSRRDDLKSVCEDQVKAGKMTPAGRDIIVNGLDRHIYSDESGFSISFEIFKEFCGTIPKILDTREYGKDGGKNKGGGKYQNANQEVDAKARQYAAEHRITYEQAVKEVLSADDDLAERYFGEEPEIELKDRKEKDETV